MQRPLRTAVHLLLRQASATDEGLVLLEAAGPGAAALLADALKGALLHASGPLQARRGF